MLADNPAVGVADESFEAFAGKENGFTEALEINFRVTDVPADIDHDEEVVTVRSQDLLELALKILHALVKLVNGLNRPGQPPMRAGPGVARRLAEGGDEGDLA